MSDTHNPPPLVDVFASVLERVRSLGDDLAVLVQGANLDAQAAFDLWARFGAGADGPFASREAGLRVLDSLHDAVNRAAIPLHALLSLGSAASASKREGRAVIAPARMGRNVITFNNGAFDPPRRMFAVRWDSLFGDSVLPQFLSADDCFLLGGLPVVVLPTLPGSDGVADFYPVDDVVALTRAMRVHQREREEFANSAADREQRWRDAERLTSPAAKIEQLQRQVDQLQNAKGPTP